eukprot:gene9164-11231_t
MTSIIKFKALSGADNENPPCYLLEIDDACILLDCGLNSSLDTSLLEPLREYAPKIDAVLISYPDITHMGGLPFAISKLGLTGKIYGTTPIFKMGQMFLYDLFENKMEQEEFEGFDLDDVDACFEKKRFKELSYSQHFSLEGKGKGISITPYLAGHMIGGAVWKITKETDSIIYAVDFNHRKEGHLDGLSMISDILKPTLLITDTRNAQKVTTHKKQLKDKLLFDAMKDTLRKGGNVLLPVDTAGRVLELLLGIEAYWTQYRLGIYNVVFLNHFTYNICEFAKSQLEFMSSNASIKFEQKNENAFSFRNIKLCHSLYDLQDLSKPKVVLASSKDLETGFSRDLFLEWANDPRNLIIFTDSVESNTLAAKVLNISQQQQQQQSASMMIIDGNENSRIIQVRQGKRVELEGEELRKYELEQQKKKEEERQLERKLKEEAELAKLKEISTISSTNDDDTIDDTFILKNPFQNRFDLTREQFTNPSEGGLVPMFPAIEKIKKWGDYGEEDEDILTMADLSKTDEEMLPIEFNENEEAKPKKIVYSDYNVEINCKIMSIDYEGCSDGVSIKTIISHIAPTKVVLIRGNQECRTMIETYIKANLRCKGVYTPSILESIDLTSDTNVYKVILKDSLVGTLTTSKLGDYEISYIQAKIQINQDETSTSSKTPVLDVLAANETKGHNAVFVGDMKLSDFKQILIKNGFQVQFDQGILNCNGLVYLWREEIDGNSFVNMDGIISDEYYLVKELLYQQYQIL